MEAYPWGVLVCAVRTTVSNTVGHCPCDPNVCRLTPTLPSTFCDASAANKMASEMITFNDFQRSLFIDCSQTKRRDHYQRLFSKFYNNIKILRGTYILLVSVPL